MQPIDHNHSGRTHLFSAPPSDALTIILFKRSQSRPQPDTEYPRNHDGRGLVSDTPDISPSNRRYAFSMNSHQHNPPGLAKI
jgi:hypothetical protein